MKNIFLTKPMKIAITGMHGFIGSRISQLLSQDFELVSLGRSEEVDITKSETVENAIARSNADIILHLAAYTNVDEAEKQKLQGETSEAWLVNVVGAENVAKAAAHTNKKLIHVSTDMVFGAVEQDYYHEADSPSPVNFYGETKYKGEKKALESGAEVVILRPAYPYTFKAEKGDFVRAFIKLFKAGNPFSSVADGYYAPTYIDDIALVIKTIVEKNLTGVIHATSGEKLSGFEIAQKIADKLGFDRNLVSPTTREAFFKDRAPRAKNTTLYNDTLNRLGIKLHSLDEALEEIPQELLA